MGIWWTAIQYPKHMEDLPMCQPLSQDAGETGWYPVRVSRNDDERYRQWTKQAREGFLDLMDYSILGYELVGGGVRVAFDFDGTLTRIEPSDDSTGKYLGPNRALIGALRAHARKGDTVYIVTARGLGDIDKRLTERGQMRIRQEGVPSRHQHPLVHAFVRRFRLPVEEIVFTGGAAKGPFLWDRGISRLYDDQPAQLLSAVNHGIDAYRVEDTEVFAYPE